MFHHALHALEREPYYLLAGYGRARVTVHLVTVTVMFGEQDGHTVERRGGQRRQFEAILLKIHYQPVRRGRLNN